MSEYAGKERFCAGKGYHARSGFMPCSRKGKYPEGGKLWCFQHQPSKRKALREAADRKWKEEWDAKRARDAKRDRVSLAEQRLVDGVMELDPIPVGCEWLGELIEAVRKARAS